MRPAPEELRLEELHIPRTLAAGAALEAVTHFSSPALVNHCIRSYLLATARGVIEGLEVDHELLYVASLLHDLGLEAPFDSHVLPFEEAGGAIAWVFAAGAGWSAARRARARDVVIAHMHDPDPSIDPEGHLLSRATALDIAGTGYESWPADLLREVVGAYPRHDLGVRFTRCFDEQRRRKPHSLAAIAMRGGLAARLDANPLDRLGSLPPRR